MAITVDQHSQIASVYDKTVADHMLPLEQRQAFARKASWFRMLARIAAKRAAAANKHQDPREPLPEGAFTDLGK